MLLPDGNTNPSQPVFEKGYVYIHPKERHIYRVDAADTPTPFALTEAEGVKELNLSRNAEWVVYVARPGAAAGEQLYVASTQNGAQRLLVPSSALPEGSSLGTPTFSPSGRQVAFSYSNGLGFFIGLVNTDGSGLRRVQLAAATPLAPNFKDEQTLWVVSLEGGHMVLLEINTAMGVELNRRTQVGLPTLSPSSRLTFSPDGECVAWSAAANNAHKSPRIFVWEFSSNTYRQLTEPTGNAAAKDFLPFWKDRTTVLWTREEAGVFRAYSARFNESNTVGTLVLENALNTVYGPF